MPFGGGDHPEPRSHWTLERNHVEGFEYAALIPTQDSQAAIRECLKSLFRQGEPPERVLVLDRGSRDDTLVAIRESFPSVETLSLPRRTTVSGALNRGIAETCEPLVVVLFPEANLGRGYCTGILEILMDPAHGDAGFATGKIFKMFRGRGTLDSAGLALGEPGSCPVKRGEGQRCEGRFEALEPVMGTAHGAVFYRRAFLLDVALFGEIFDESLDGILEDADLSWRAHRLGWRGLFVPSATAIYDARDGTPGFRGLLGREYARRVLTLKNAPTEDLLPRLPAVLLPPSPLANGPAGALTSLLALARLGASLGTIRCKRQEIQRRAAGRTPVPPRAPMASRGAAAP